MNQREHDELQRNRRLLKILATRALLAKLAGTLTLEFPKDFKLTKDFEIFLQKDSSYSAWRETEEDKYAVGRAENDYKQAEEFYKKAKQAIEDKKYTDSIKFYQSAGIYYRKIPEKFYQLISEKYAGIECISRIESCDRQLGTIYHQRYHENKNPVDLRIAHNYYLKTLKCYESDFFKKNEQHWHLLNAYHAISNIHYEEGTIAKGLEYSLLALNACKTFYGISAETADYLTTVIHYAKMAGVDMHNAPISKNVDEWLAYFANQLENLKSVALKAVQKKSSIIGNLAVWIPFGSAMSTDVRKIDVDSEDEQTPSSSENEQTPSSRLSSSR